MGKLEWYVALIEEHSVFMQLVGWNEILDFLFKTV